MNTNAAASNFTVGSLSNNVYSNYVAWVNPIKSFEFLEDAVCFAQEEYNKLKEGTPVGFDLPNDIVIHDGEEIIHY